jgi:transcriptional regulator with XRE-family HTH domain
MAQDSLARNLRVLRAERGMTLTEASRLSGVNISTISSLEHGERGAYTATLRKLADAYGITLTELLGEASPVVVGKADAPDAGHLFEAALGDVMEALHKTRADLGALKRVTSTEDIRRTLKAAEADQTELEEAVYKLRAILQEH